MMWDKSAGEQEQRTWSRRHSRYPPLSELAALSLSLSLWPGTPASLRWPSAEAVVVGGVRTLKHVYGHCIACHEDTAKA